MEYTKAQIKNLVAQLLEAREANGKVEKFVKDRDDKVSKLKTLGGITNANNYQSVVDAVHVILGQHAEKLGGFGED